MTITLELAPPEAALLEARTRSQGEQPAEYVRRVVLDDLGREMPEKNRAASALLQEWLDEEVPENESAEAVRNWEENMKSLDQNRMSARPLFPAMPR